MSHSSILIDQSGPISMSLVALSAHAAAAFAILYQNKITKGKGKQEIFSSNRIENPDTTEIRKRHHNEVLTRSERRKLTDEKRFIRSVDRTDRNSIIRGEKRRDN